MTETIGFSAAFLTTLSFLPQAVHILRTRQTDGISLLMYVLFTTGVAAWLVYGLLSASLPMIFANGVTLVLATLILFLKAKAVLTPPQPSVQGATEATSAPIA
jgi:MtN3 and saliva related transmembrane protein